MCDDGDGFLSSDDVRLGYIKPFGTTWKKVSYANVDGLAVFEGCILLGTTEDLEKSKTLIETKLKSMPKLLKDPKIKLQGVAIKGQQFRWPGRLIPFVLPNDFPNPKRVTDAIAHWHSKTKIRFIPRNTQNDYVHFKAAELGCASIVGRKMGMQELVLRSGCTTGHIIHELGHTVGLWHEQSRADRNNFVEVDLRQIDQNKAHNFDQHIQDGIDIGDYDFGSIMHYPPGAFSVTGNPSITPKVPLPPGVVMGQRNGLSAGDIATVEALYKGIAPANV
jgi:hypothetical protein